MTDNIIDRDELQEKLIQWDLSQMSLDDLKEYFINMQNAELDCLSVDELIEEVQAVNNQDAKETALARNPRAKVIGVNPMVGS